VVVRVSNYTGTETKRGIVLEFSVRIDDVDIAIRMIEAAKARGVPCPELIKKVVHAIFEQANSTLIDAVLDDK
jgi:hypothetical protein